MRSILGFIDDHTDPTKALLFAVLVGPLVIYGLRELRVAAALAAVLHLCLVVVTNLVSTRRVPYGEIAEIRIRTPFRWHWQKWDNGMVQAIVLRTRARRRIACEGGMGSAELRRASRLMRRRTAEHQRCSEWRGRGG